jgi:hypothetical protein
MRRALAALIALLLPGLLLASRGSDRRDAIECPVTVPNGPGPGEAFPRKFGTYGLATALWADGRVEFRPGGAGCVDPDGYLGMKWPWRRGVPGSLTIEGRRLDVAARPLWAHTNDGYGRTGFQASRLLFSSPGRWEVTARAGDASLTFVTRVVKIEAGPESVCERLSRGYRHEFRKLMQARP